LLRFHSLVSFDTVCFVSLYLLVSIRWNGPLESVRLEMLCKPNNKVVTLCAVRQFESSNPS
jgi:hypothetical protein